ncbi:alpha/beta hydrolase [Pseudorhodobacter wandonensis]|uniref:alpha/beta hydrolase n=1 Tax=Pseudorhodobacter wandonensis TaxID=1120568 RepID=UPI00067BEBF1|nr:alpha/beta hydrolase [Pseudorhodobacter wandonensis]
MDAPLYNDLAQGPAGGRAYWLTAKDGTRLRMAAWPGGDKGTVLLFPGRTEYIEKYGRVAAEFAARGYGCVAIDWRGQGLSDRPKPDPMVGHIEKFSNYQLDLQAVLAKLDELSLTGPLYLVAHSMGGCIGLRALLNGLNVKAAAFTAPMWGIRMAPGLAPVARMVARTARALGQGHRYAPGTNGDTYVNTFPYFGNVLTRDAETYAWMQNQLKQQPSLALGGPGLHWLDEAMHECRNLANLPSPDLACLCFLGAEEKVVDPLPIHDRMARWPKGNLVLVPNAEHEIMMEIPSTRQQFFEMTTELFQKNT